MLQSDNQYSKLRWLLTLGGLFLYVFDIWTDVGLALKHFQDGHYVWSGLTVMFVLTGLLVTQIFSIAWYWDDMSNVFINPQGKSSTSGRTKCGLAALHVFGMGVFTRYYHLLKKGIDVIWTSTNSYTEEEIRDVHKILFGLATDLSMLRLFEAFLESVPQLLLQIYIILGHDEGSVMQYLSVAFSFFNAAWALVDYRRCLRRSLPNIREMPSGLPTAIYLLYKLCTITSHILSYSLLLMLSTYSTIALTVVWLLGTVWTHLLHTNFCESRSLEILYRAVVGVILTFTFFNVKGQNTKVPMIIYYSFYYVVNFAAPILLYFFKQDLQTSTFLLVSIGLISGCSVLGMLCLLVYYLFLHPRGKQREADEVDGLREETETTSRISRFLQP
uniref:XK-related protein n=1 Tax=Acanthochromis polyacanthus TaxID=80966 RepID=A0A3Q1EGA4_9TELE